MNELNFNEGFCVVYNKSSKNISLKNKQKNINGMQYVVTENNKRIFFLTINLNDIFYKSKKTL